MPFDHAAATLAVADNAGSAGYFGIGGDGTAQDGRDRRRLAFVSPAHPLRTEAEACIRDVYERSFGARDLVFANVLAAWVDGDDRLLCAAGLRTSLEGFFSEVYLDEPIERVLHRRTGMPVARDSVFEVTTLASTSVEASTGFLHRLARFGRSAGYRWSFFTATARLRKLLGELGYASLELADADPARLPDPTGWGDYYGHSPRVCAVTDPRVHAGAATPVGDPADA